MTKNLERKKKNKHREQQIEEGPFSIPRYNLWFRTCIPNIKFLSLTVVEISLTKNLEIKKKEEQIGECPFAIPRYNLSLLTCIPNMKFLS